ncbi:MAG: Lrp/AsnC ligand binding domain-containing protein [Chloroflexi bacterium]|nr:Lrp/AsnC ligand binding domain-containing protein [Chloroflexota bacterium]
MKIRAYILIEASAGTGNRVLGAIRDLPATLQADRVTGPYDVIAVVESDDLNALRSVLRDRVESIPGITRTMTCLRFEG